MMNNTTGGIWVPNLKFGRNKSNWKNILEEIKIGFVDDAKSLYVNWV